MLWGAAVGAGGAAASPSTADTVQRLLTLLSPTVRLEPGLLRAVRCLWPEGRRDPGLEAWVWQDPALASQHYVAASWQPKRRSALLAQFAEQPEALRKAVLDLVKLWRADLGPAVWLSEIVNLDPQSKQVAIDPNDLEDAARFLTQLADDLEKIEELPAATGAWIEHWPGRFTEAIGYDPRVQQAVHRLYELVRPRDSQTQVPVWYDPAALSSPELPVRQVELWQAADQLVVQTVGQPPVERGSRLGLLYTASGEVVVSPGAATETKAQVLDLNRQPRLAIALSKEGGFRLGTDRDRLQCGRITVPECDWAREIGRDTFGLWAAFEIAGVRQCLRWIPPGRFWMGSPEEEAGRYDDEGPRHEVQLTQGFWLFDTPCTQDLWQAVMGENPSRFKGKDWQARPVEQVNWEDCQQFIATLNARWPKLALALPTEAEWEYACRAGTTTARYADDLDVIAWYRENSGNETKPVKGKQPNAWGLYDMLGNVDEWCHDGLRNYAAPIGPDPLGPTNPGAFRVIRGGLWIWIARDVRSACRYAYRPGGRYGYLGFRCASSGQASRLGR
ncbi:MAG: formylglycine-generating enzyme family protein [Deltaproteobacteria bacterium]|nr:formylglycine-generating enzyme family protein [Deltaproteobacteria bacterium]